MPIYNTKKKNKDGITKYQVRINYTNNNGENKQLTRIAYGLKEAKQLELTLSNKSKKGTIKKMTVDTLCKEYIKAKKYSVRETTLFKKERILLEHVIPHLKDKSLTQLNVKTLTEWKIKIESRKFKINTKKSIYGELMAMLNYAVKMEYLQSNPLSKVGNFIDPYEAKRDIQFYTPEEFLRYKQCALERAREQNFYDFYVFFAIAYYTGARKGEIHALRWSDYDGCTISIRKSIAQNLKGGDRETPPKNKSSNRDVKLPTPLISILDEHYERMRQTTGFTENYHICGGIRALRDTPLSNENFKNAKAANLHRLRIHDFRHSHASLLANAGVNIMEISRRLGHSNIEQTLNTYSHLYPKEENIAVQVLNKIE